MPSVNVYFNPKDWEFINALPGENVSQKVKGLVGRYRSQLLDNGKEEEVKP